MFYRGWESPRLTHQQNFSAVVVPSVVVGCLEVAGKSHRALWLAQCTDVSLAGETHEEWLLVSADEMSVIRVRGSVANEGNAPGGVMLRSVTWASVAAVRTQAGVGGGTLQVRIGEDWIDLLRFSNANATRFHKVSRMLERMREHPETWMFDATGSTEQDPHGSSTGFDPPECPTCSLRLSSKEESCPRCMQKGQILRRVHTLIAPYRRGAILLSLLTIVGVIAELIPPKLQQYLIDQVLAGGNTAVAQDANHPLPDFRTALLLIVLALAASRVMLSIVAVFKGKLATHIGTGLTRTLRAEMVRKLQSLAVVYYDRHQVGSMLGRVAHDSEVMHGLMHQITGGFLLQIAQLIGVGGLLFSGRRSIRGITVCGMRRRNRFRFSAGCYQGSGL
jgi:hypothetical protein